MKRKIISIVFATIATVSASFCFTACGDKKNGDDNGGDHVHRYEEYYYNNDGTCVADGTETAKCVTCDETNTCTKTGTATGEHVYANYVYNNDATCVTDGTETAKCVTCDETDTRTKAGTATGAHVYVNYVYNNDATCVTDGTETAKCVTCDETNTRTKLNSAAHRYNDHVCEICYAIDPSAPETEGLEFYPITKNNVVVGYEVKSIGSAANDRYIKIPSSYNGLPVTGLMNYSFKASKCLNIEISSSVTYLGRAVFQDSKIRSIVIPNTVTEVGDFLFQDCADLIDAKISDNVTRLGMDFFYKCVSLKSVTISGDVTSMSYTFIGCSSLEVIKFGGTKDKWKGISKKSGWNSDSGDYTVQCTDGRLDKNDNGI